MGGDDHSPAFRRDWICPSNVDPTGAACSTATNASRKKSFSFISYRCRSKMASSTRKKGRSVVGVERNKYHLL